MVFFQILVHCSVSLSFYLLATFYVAIETLLRYYLPRWQLWDHPLERGMHMHFLLYLFFVLIFFSVKLSFPKIIAYSSFFCHLHTRPEFITLCCVHIRAWSPPECLLFLLTNVFYFMVFVVIVVCLVFFAYNAYLSGKIYDIACNLWQLTTANNCYRISHRWSCHTLRRYVDGEYLFLLCLILTLYTNTNTNTHIVGARLRHARTLELGTNYCATLIGGEYCTLSERCGRCDTVNVAEKYDKKKKKSQLNIDNRTFGIRCPKTRPLEVISFFLSLLQSIDLSHQIRIPKFRDCLP